jgi:hypothetical protein
LLVSLNSYPSGIELVPGPSSIEILTARPPARSTSSASSPVHPGRKQAEVQSAGAGVHRCAHAIEPEVFGELLLERCHLRTLGEYPAAQDTTDCRFFFLPEEWARGWKEVTHEGQYRSTRASGSRRP